MFDNVLRYAQKMAFVCMAAGMFLMPLDGKGQTTISETIPRSTAFFGVHFDLHPSATDTILGRDASSRNISTFLERVKPDFVQYDCKGHGGYTGYPTKVGYASPGIVKDALRLWRTETRRRGIGLYIHYSGVWDSAAVRHHPEWARVDENGKPDPDITSVFGDYARDLMIPQLKEVTSEYDLDGVWVDGDCWGAKLDYGTTAVAAWKAETGKENVPKKADDPDWQEWKNFHRRGFENYLVNWVDELHRHDPELQITSNWSYTPHMPVPIKAKVDFLSGDFSAKESVDRARFEARYLDSTGMPWDLMSWGFNSYRAGNAGPHQLKTAEQLMQEASVVMGLGGGVQVYFQPTRGGYVSPQMTETAGTVADFCRERQQISHKSKTVPQVALLLSSKSFLERSDNVYSPHGQYNALEGALHALLENGYSVDLLAEHQLKPKMDDYPVIAIAQAPVLEEEFRDAAMAYVHRGGKVVLLDQESTKPFRSYLQLSGDAKVSDGDAFVGDVNGTAAIPGGWEAVVVEDGAEVLEHRTDGQGIVSESKDGRTTAGTTWTKWEPAATRTEVLSGSIIAIHGPASQAYFDAHHPVIREWIGGIMEEAFPKPTARLVDAPNVDMSLRQAADGTECVHLVNLSGAQRADRFAAVDHLPGSGTVKLEWRLERKPISFRQLPGDKKLKFEVESEGERHAATVAIENVPLHAVIVPEFSEEKPAS